MCYSKDIIRTARNVTLPYCYHMWVCPYWVPTKVNCKHTDTEFPHRSWQSGHGRPGGHWGGSTTVDLLGRWKPLDAVTNLALPQSLLLLRLQGCCRWGGARVLVGSKRGGRTSVHGDGGDGDTGLTPIFWCGVFDALFFRKVWGRAWCWCYYLD